MGQFAAFTRVQESTADQIAAKLLLATHQSPMGMFHTFQRFANEEAMSAYKIDKFAVDHPTGQDRVFDLQDMVDASPYARCKIHRKACTPSRWCRPSWPAMCFR